MVIGLGAIVADAIKILVITNTNPRNDMTTGDTSSV